MTKNSELHERRVKAICWPGDEGTELNSSEEIQLVAFYEYLGDRVELWVLRIEDDEEVSRWNAKYLEGDTSEQ